MDYMRPCGGVPTCNTSRSTTVAVFARHSGYRQEWRSNGPASSGNGRGRGGRGAGRGRGGRTSSPRTPNRPFTDDADDADGYGPSSRSGGASSRFPRPERRGSYDNNSGYNSGRSRTFEAPPPSRRAAAPRDAEPPGEPQDPFGNLCIWIQMQHRAGVVIRRETWEKLLGHLRFPAQAAQALDLLLADAEVREGVEWDWGAHGFGQTAFQLIRVAAAAGAPELAERLLERREALHITLNKDLVPTLIRKVAAATADAADDGDLDACVDVVQRLYKQEVALRGANSPEAAYELSRVLRRAEDVPGVRTLYDQMESEGLAVRDRLLEDVEKWLAKRGVRV